MIQQLAQDLGFGGGSPWSGSVQYSAWRGGGDREEEKEEIERLMLKSNRAFNETWVFTASFGGNIRLWQPIPAKVRNELFAALSLSLLAYMDLRNPYDPVCTVSDAPEES